MEKKPENKTEKTKPKCPKCKTTFWVKKEELIVHLDIHRIWICQECDYIIERIK